MSEKSQKELKVAVYWPPSSLQVGFKGEAVGVSSENKMGKFDILPEHTNFITLIFNKLIVHTPEKKKKIEYTFKRGVLEVSENSVNVFLGI
jgi:F0F1-type ATP synthase epsilon subunit